ncbi:MAG: sugar phosphate isomerase/epimerase [Mycobacterium sp.]
MLNATPFELVDAAAAGGFDMCGVRIVAPDPDQSVFDLVNDHAMRRRFADYLVDSGVRLLDVEAVWIRENTDVATLAPALDAAADLGSQYVLTVGYDFHRPRLVDTLGRLADAAADRGLLMPVEFITYSAITSLADVVDVTAAVDRDNLRILVDFLQFFRAGAEWDVLAGIAEAKLPYAQICDGPLASPTTVDALRHEARSARLIPGEGDLDLHRLIATLPSDIPLSIETPNLDLARLPFDEAARILREATLRLLEPSPA